MTDWELWSIDTIAERTDYKRRSIERFVTLPDFPAPVEAEPGARPRWVASEVAAWFESRRRAA